MSVEGVLNQVFQPYFFYSMVFLITSFVCVKVFTRFCHFIGERTKSLLYLIPLIVPLVVMAIFLPSTAFQTTVVDVKTGTSINAGPINFPTDSSILASASQVTTLSVTGILCIIGLAAGAFFALTMIISDDRIARRMLRVILLSSGEHPWLQATVAESAKKLGIACPKIGVVEDLRPNAFTIGYGRRATVVFSIGLFNLLDKEEMTAVALHELSHVKHHDFFFKTLTSTLTAISFFNPIAFITASTAQRQREMFADEGAVALLNRPSALSSALTKICSSVKTLPEESIFARSSASLLVTSSVLHRPGILATHPRLDKRLGNISKRKASIHLNNKVVALAVLLSVILVSSFILSSYAIFDLQQSGLAYNQGLKTPIGVADATGDVHSLTSITVLSQGNTVSANAHGGNERMLYRNINNSLNETYLVVIKPSSSTP